MASPQDPPATLPTQRELEKADPEQLPTENQPATLELSKRLELSSDVLVGDVFDLVRSTLDGEVSRQTIIEGKASGLTNSVGLTLSLTGVFAGVILRGEAHGAATWAVYAPLLLLSFSTILGIAAACFAQDALRIREYKGISEKDLFSNEVLQEADTTVENGGSGPVFYRRYMAEHLWMLVRATQQIHEAKAKSVLCGQKLFLAGLISIGLAVLSITVGRLC
jgi:hypothetical protein